MRLSIVSYEAKGSGHLQGILLGTKALRGAVLLLLGAIACLKLVAIAIGIDIGHQVNNLCIRSGSS